jgi:hypothetical protein
VSVEAQIGDPVARFYIFRGESRSQTLTARTEFRIRKPMIPADDTFFLAVKIDSAIKTPYGRQRNDHASALYFKMWCQSWQPKPAFIVINCRTAAIYTTTPPGKYAMNTAAAARSLQEQRHV